MWIGAQACSSAAHSSDQLINEFDLSDTSELGWRSSLQSASSAVHTDCLACVWWEHHMTPWRLMMPQMGSSAQMLAREGQETAQSASAAHLTSWIL